MKLPTVKISACLARCGCGVRHGMWHARFVLSFLLVVAVLCGTLVCVVSGGIADVTSPYMLTPDHMGELPSDVSFDCVLILGAGLRPDGSPSEMLADRVRTGCAVFLSDPERFGKLLLSGDRTGDYDEVTAMRTLAISLGVPEARILSDYEGYSTFESISRARDQFGIHRPLIVTQKYHLHRAVYVARTLGMNAYGVTADARPYAKRIFRESREALARFKDFFEAGRAG